jgi:hypothetical protein
LTASLRRRIVLAAPLSLAAGLVVALDMLKLQVLPINESH